MVTECFHGRKPVLPSSQYCTKHLPRIHVVRAEINKTQATSRPDCSWPKVWSNTSKNCQRKETRHCAIEQPKLDDARKLRVISDVDLDDTEFKDTMKKCAKAIGVQLESAMPC